MGTFVFTCPPCNHQITLPLSVAGKKGRGASCDAVNVTTAPGSTSALQKPPLQQPIQTDAYTNPYHPHFGTNNESADPNGHAIRTKMIIIFFGNSGGLDINHSRHCIHVR